MNRTITLLITLLFTVAWIGVRAQVRVIGHVSAEVVESVSAHNNINTYVKINPVNQGNIELGNIDITGTSETTFDVSVANTNIQNEANNYSLRTGMLSTGSSLIADNSGNHSLTLSALIDDEISTGNYRGDLTVIVSYN